MDRDIAAKLIDTLDDINTALETIATNTSPADANAKAAPEETRSEPEPEPEPEEPKTTRSTKK